MKLDDYAEMLLSGTPGKDVVKIMEQNIENVCSIRVAMTSIRRKVLTSTDPRRFHPKYMITIKKMNAASAQASPDVSRKYKTFLKNNLKYKYDAKRKLRTRKTFFGDKKLDTLLGQLDIFPTNMNNFVLPKSIAKHCQDISKHNLQVANENLRIINNATQLINECIDYIIDGISGKKVSDKKLGICLMLVSGRRTAEIFNGKSIFTKGSTPTSVMFKGQVKKNEAGEEENDLSYEIPLLCYADTFMKGFALLQNMQGNKQFTNKQVNSKYQTNLSYWLKQMFPLPAPRNSVARYLTPHDMRRFYVVAVFEMYNYIDEGIAINTVAMNVLGHENLETSLAYNIHLKNLTAEFPPEYRPNLKKNGTRIRKRK